MNYKLRLILLSPFYLYASLSFGSGNTLPRPSSDALGMADANVALAEGPSAQFINPANMVSQEKETTEWEVGGLLASVASTYNRPLTMGAASAGGFDIDNHLFIPYLAFTHRLSEQITVGFSVDSPHGLSVEWPDHTWDIDLSGFGLPPADLVSKAELTVIRLGPALAIKTNGRWRFGGRLFYQYVDAKDENDFATVKGDGNTLGIQVGINYQNENFIFGSAYTSRTNTEIKGSQNNIHPIAAAAGALPGNAKADILLPDRLQAGVAFRVSRDLWWEIDLDWLGWSYFDELTIFQSNGLITNAGKNRRHSENTLSVRTGMKWEYRPDMALYAGLGYDPSPVPERDVSPITNMLRKTRIGFGAMLGLNNGMKLGLAYQYIRGHSRRINETGQDSFSGVDTNIFEGTYESDSHVLAVNLSGAI